jgi:hypothetical protein
VQLRSHGNDWQKTLWKILGNPAIEVVAAIAVVLVSAWVVVQTEAGERQQVFPVPFGQK